MIEALDTLLRQHPVGLLFVILAVGYTGAYALANVILTVAGRLIARL